MSTIIIGDTTWQNDEGTNTDGGWNSTGRIWGSADDDTFTYTDQSWITKAAGSHSWSIDGGDGVNTLSVSNSTAGVSILFASSYISHIDILEGSSLKDKLGGDSPSETIEGGAGADSLWGAGGSDSLIGGAGADSYWFGINDGTDTIADEGYDNQYDAVVFYSSSFSQLGFSRVNNDIDIQISVNVSDGYSDTVLLEKLGSYMDTNSSYRINKFIAADATFGLSIGVSGDESITGSSIADYITGGDGNDTIDGGLGGDAIYGNEGDDMISYSASAAWLDGGDGSNTLTAETSSAAVSFIADSSGKIANFSTLVGSSLGDLIGGSSAADSLQAGAGADSLWGGSGEANDQLNGGTGSDSYWFGSGDGADTIVSEATNYSDCVMFYDDGVGAGAIVGVALTGDNLTLTLASGASLTIIDWQRADAYKLNTFNFGGNGTWQLSMDSNNNATWTAKI